MKTTRVSTWSRLKKLPVLEFCTPGTRRLQEVGVTLLDFESEVTLGFDQDQDAIQDAFTNAVTNTYTVENVAETLQTPELEEKYGEFEVIKTETGGTISTLVSVAHGLNL